MTEDYRVNLDIYNGPLDLLLYLIRRSEVDIYDIPIAEITRQYLQYIEVIRQMDINLAGEFLVMAATLLEIKSALLIPRGEAAEDQAEDNLADPRLELVRQLLEYKKFKDAAGELHEAAEEQSQRFARSLADLDRLRDEEKQHEQELDLEGVQIWDLFDAFSRLMQATLAGARGHEVIEDDTPVDVYEVDILDRAQREKTLTFEAIFKGCKYRTEMVGLFLALLELIRMKLVRIEQEHTFSPIYLFALTEEDPQKAVAHAISSSIERLPSEINRDKQHPGDHSEPPANDRPVPPAEGGAETETEV